MLVKMSSLKFMKQKAQNGVSLIPFKDLDTPFGPLMPPFLCTEDLKMRLLTFQQILL